MSNVPVIGLIVTKMLTAVWQILVPFLLGVLAMGAGIKQWPARDWTALWVLIYAYIILAVAGILGVF